MHPGELSIESAWFVVARFTNIDLRRVPLGSGLVVVDLMGEWVGERTTTVPSWQSFVALQPASRRTNKKATHVRVGGPFPHSTNRRDCSAFKRTLATDSEGLLVS
jgi:hypothetical protein